MNIIYNSNLEFLLASAIKKKVLLFHIIETVPRTRQILAYINLSMSERVKVSHECDSRLAKMNARRKEIFLCDECEKSGKKREGKGGSLTKRS